ncbi:hypothetical protein Lal_00020080 [Lupinus albus]|nr:hypothetical protein Lal_00020080 [Lupinus albus]
MERKIRDSDKMKCIKDEDEKVLDDQNYTLYYRIQDKDVKETFKRMENDKIFGLDNIHIEIKIVQSL